MLIVCPLKYEASIIRRSLAREGAPADVVCCGPGSAGIARLDERIADNANFDGVVLVGVAGSLCDSHRAGAAFAISEVRDEQGNVYSPTIGSDQTPRSIITSNEGIVTSREARGTLAEQTGAHMVDQESTAFAKLANARDWRWGIVRGVSDDLHTLAPPAMATWVDASGRTRHLAVLASLMRRPSLLREVRCLHDNSRSALVHAARLIAKLR